MVHLYSGVFLLIILLNAAPKSKGLKSVAGVKEEDVTLSCLRFNVTDPASCYRVRLIKTAMDTSVQETIFEWPKESQEAKRVSLEANREGQMCLFLKSMEKSDEGQYRYEVWKGWDLVQNESISLKMKDCRRLKPERATLNKTAKLQCQVNAASAPSNIFWGKLKGESIVSVDSERSQTNGTFLIINSVSTGDGGWYRCNYTAGQIQHCFEINLQVQVEDVFVVTMVPLPAATKPRKASEVLQTTEREKNNETTVLVTMVVFGILILTALTGLFLYYKGVRFRRHQNHTEDLHYENVTLPHSLSSSNRVNSLYWFDEESMSTCE